MKHKDAVSVLRQKGYTWREIAEFLTDQGVQVDHTTLFRLFKGVAQMTNESISVPDANVYAVALEKINVTPIEKKMLLAHYASHNRAITYTDLAKAANFDDNKPANSGYGRLGHRLGDAIGFNFEKFKDSGVEWYSSALGMQMPEPWAAGEMRIVMHHEVARALEQLLWVK